MVLGFQYRAEAERFLQDWRERLQRFELELHPDKTRWALGNRRPYRNFGQVGILPGNGVPLTCPKTM
jgi:RNA-directed DNA polymerase